MDISAGPRRIPLLVAVVLSLSAMTGCDLYVEHVCSEGEQPMYALDNPYGGHCAKDGDAVSWVWARYPPKRVPEVMGDKYDRWPLAKDYPWADEISAEVRERARQLRKHGRQ